MNNQTRTARTGKEQITIDVNNPYVQCVFKVFRQFLIEEATGQACTVDRLNCQLDRARTLYDTERRALTGGRAYWGRWDELNTELILSMNMQP